MAEDADRSRVRQLLPTLCIGLATLLAVIAALTTWVRAQALDTDQWVDTSTELLDDPAVTDAVAVFLVDQIYAGLDVESEFASNLPEDFERLAGPLSAALRGPATEAAQRLVASDRFRATWSTANRVAHQSVVNVLRDDTRTGRLGHRGCHHPRARGTGPRRRRRSRAVARIDRAIAPRRRAHHAGRIRSARDRADGRARARLPVLVRVARRGGPLCVGGLALR